MILKLSFLSLTLLLSWAVCAQNEAANRYFPKYKKEEVIIRVNPNLLEHEVIDNPNIKQGSLNGFLNGKGKKEVDGIHGKPLDLPSLKVRKMFPDLRSCDRKSISRQGKEIDIPPFWATFVVEKPKNVAYVDFLKGLKASFPVIIYAHPNFIFETTSFPDDSLFLEQLSLYNPSNPATSINIDSAWQIETGKKHIKVGVFDTGIDSSHVDLDVLTGYGYYHANGDNGWGHDLRGHGTSVAGIIGAKRNNQRGIAGIAGGNGSDSSGVSLLDFKYANTDGVIEDVNFFASGLINASRSIGSKYTWDLGGNPPCPDGFPGYGIHIGNHSYGIALELHTLPIIDSIFEDFVDYMQPCDLCIESFLFSLKNGVVNVVSRGNLNFNSGFSDYHSPYMYPANYPDSWAICVGSTGSDGEWFYGPTNGDEQEKPFFSPLGRQLDLLAPGSTTVVATTASSTGIAGSNHDLYRKFNGTSAAAPHVAGVVALMLSYYNKPCYSNINLDPADVEYILEHSATDLLSPGYDDTTAYGRLDAHKALQMIQFPEYQIVHPTADAVNTTVLSRDTIHAYLGSPLSLFEKGPLSNEYPFFSEQPKRNYKIERLLVENEYNFSSYLLNSTEIKDVWIRHGQTTSVDLTEDTLGILELVGTTGQYAWKYVPDTFNIMPMAEIAFIDKNNGKIRIQGHYYHFIESYLPGPTFDFVDKTVNFWYPINPLVEKPEMAYSLYLYDENFTERYDFPCDSLNPLLDTTALSLVEQFKATTAFAVYPNPGTDELHIQIKHLQPGEQKLRLMNAQGQILWEEQLEKEQHTIQLNCRSFEYGVYFVQWWQNDRLMQTKKWIKL